MFRVIIAGSRYFNDYGMFCETTDRLLKNKREANEEIVILSGHCHGADLLGERYALERGYRLEIYRAQWTEYGPSAGPRRNRRMAERADALIAFWNGMSNGTRNMIEEARKAGLDVRIKRY